MRATSTTFTNILNTIHENGITSKNALMAACDLYDAFWFAAMDFSHFTLLSKTSGKSRTGEVLPGNAGKINVLTNRGAATRDELETDCVIRMIDKLDLILRQPIEKQKNYCYTICNNIVNDRFRQLPPNDIQLVSLNSTVEGATDENSYTYEDIIRDDAYSGERIVLEQESIQELTAQLHAKKAREQAEERAAILRETERLSKKPAEVLVRLACEHLHLKPRELANRIIRSGCETTYAQILFETAEKNNIAPEELRSLVANNKITEKSVKADTNNPDAVASQISRLIYRAHKRLQ